MNRVEIIGRLGKELELRKTRNGKSVIEFALADSEKVNNETVTTWINCVAWESRAETLHKYLKKGDIVYVSGKYKNESYNDQNGNKKYRTYVLIDFFQLLPNAKKEPQDNEKTNDYQTSLGGQLQTPEDTERNHTTYIDDFSDLPFN